MRRTTVVLAILGALFAVATAGAIEGGGANDGQNELFKNSTGKSASFSTTGSIDLTGTFFQSLGTNGRTCGTCHLPEDGWSVSAQSAQALFEQSYGTHPLFEFDGQNCVGADRSTVAARQSASSLMLDRGLVRLDRPLTFLAEREFELVAWEGTYCNPVDSEHIVVFRRSLPVTNFETLSRLGWDGVGVLLGQTIDDALPLLSIFAVQIHSQTTLEPSHDQLGEVLTLMQTLSTAQVKDDDAGDLTAKNALGGPENLAGLPPTGPAGFTIYDPWSDLSGTGTNAARRAVARGQAIFNLRCAGCHSSPNRGNSATGAMINLGLADASRRPPGLPLYTLRNLSTGEIKQTSDPGFAMVTGKWADIGRFKVPGLRGVVTHPPYFHNGFAATLMDVVEFYDGRFNFGLSSQDKADLVRFLRAL